MAKVRILPGYTGPAEPGEQIVLDHLIKHLSDEVVLIPNISIPHRDGADECDIVVVTSDAVFIVEVKRLFGSVSVHDQKMIVDGNERSNPYYTTRRKAQRLRSQLNNKFRWFSNGGWVSELVVLAIEPRVLDFQSQWMDKKIVKLDSCIELLSAPSPLINKGHGQLAEKIDEVVDAICGGSSIKAPQNVVGMFRKVELLTDRSVTGVQTWRAIHTITGTEHEIDIHVPPKDMSKPQTLDWRSQIIRSYTSGIEVGVISEIHMPTAVMQLESGDVVVVWPGKNFQTIQEYFNERKLDGFIEVVEGRQLIAGISSAMHHLHRQGKTWGQLNEGQIFVRDTGRGGISIDDGDLPKSTDTFPDLMKLAEIIGRLLQLCEDERLKEVHRQLLNTSKPEEIPSAGTVLATCEGWVPNQSTANLRIEGEPFNRRFEDRKVIAKHSFGATYRATDSILKRSVVVRVESGRFEESWAEREFRALTHQSAQANSGVVDVLSGGTSDLGSYVAVEELAGISLATIIDNGAFREPDVAVGVALELLSTLERLHPDVEAISAIIEKNLGKLSNDEQELIGNLRESGIAHNHIEPSNIRLIDKRGPVLFDFSRAGLFGATIPNRSSVFWPDDLPSDISDPTADLYSIGAILLALLTGPLGNGKSDFDERIGIVEAKNSLLGGILRQSLASDRTSRFTSAAKFSDALFGLKLSIKPPNFQADAWSIQRKIEALLEENNFPEAKEVCPPDWLDTLASIEKRELAISTPGHPIAEILGVTLSYIGERDLPAGTTGTNKNHAGGSAKLYVVTLPEGGVLEVQVCTAESETGLETWVGGSTGYGLPVQMRKLARSLRMNVNKVSGPGTELFIELGQARINPEAPDGNPTTKWSIGKDDVSLAVGGADVEGLFSLVGVTSYDTRQNAYGETNKRKGNLCVKFNPQNQHVPATAHFVGRVLPLFVGLKN